MERRPRSRPRPSADSRTGARGGARRPTLSDRLLPVGDQFQVNSVTSGYQLGPSVSANGGQFVVVWHSLPYPVDSDYPSLQGQRYSADGTPAGPEFQVDSLPTGYPYSYGVLLGFSSEVATGPGGEFVVVWSSYGSSGTDTDLSIQARQFAADGTPAGPEFQVNSYTTSLQDFPTVAVGPSGEFVVAWSSVGSSGTDTDFFSVQARQFAADGTPAGAEFQVNTFTPYLQFLSGVAIGPSGEFVVVWTSYGSSGTDTDYLSVQARQFAADGTPAAAEFQVNTYTTDYQAVPDVAVGPGGEFIVVWQSYGSAGTDIDYTSVQARQFAADGTPAGPEFQVNDYTTDNQAFPNVAVGPGGEFIVVWQSYGSAGTDGDYSIQARELAADGTPNGAEFQVNTVTSGDQQVPAIAADPDGRFLVVWDSEVSVPPPLGTDTDLSSIQARFFCTQADLAITKTDDVVIAAPGSALTYTVEARNDGPCPVAAASVSDIFPAALSCGWTSLEAGGATGATDNPGPASLAEVLSLPAGGSVTYTVTCAIDSGATGTLSNTATIAGGAGDPPDPDLGNNSATDADTVLVPEADLAITKSDGVTSGVPGESVVYTLVASNNGPSAANAVSVTDNFPADLSCSWTSTSLGGATGNSAASGNLADVLSMPAGSSVTYTVTCNIDPGATGTLSNTATISSSAADPDPSNNSATDADTVLAAEADLAITKSDGVTSGVPGESLFYTLVASNSGPSDAGGVSVTDNFPADLSCSWTSTSLGGATGNSAASGNLADVLSMPAGSSVTYMVTCTIDPGATGTLSNTATISSPATDPTAGNDSATDEDTLLAPAVDLSVSQIGAPDPVAFGGILTWIINVSNGGPSTATSISLTDTLPAGVRFISASGNGWTVSPLLASVGDGPQKAAGSLVFTRPSLALGQAPHILVRVEVPRGGDSTLTNLVSVASVEPDSDGTNNTSSLTVMVVPAGIPALSRLGIVVLLILLAAAALPLLRR